MNQLGDYKCFIYILMVFRVLNTCMNVTIGWPVKGL